MKLRTLFAFGVALISISLSSTLRAGSDVVLTPMGFMPSSMVHGLDAGQKLRGTPDTIDVLDWANQLLNSFPKANLSTFQTRGGWVTDSAWTVPRGNSVVSFRSIWVVPPEPVSQGAQTIFFFNGIENARMSTILQPVLQWGAAADGGGSYWAISNWFVGSEGTYFSTPMRVNAGDILVGVMTRTGGSNGVYNYTSEFEGKPGTALPVENISELVWLNETLEAYGVWRCSQYPVGTTAFKGVEVQMQNPVSKVDWEVQNRVMGCGQHTTIVDNSATGGEVDITTSR